MEFDVAKLLIEIVTKGVEKAVSDIDKIKGSSEKTAAGVSALKSGMIALGSGVVLAAFAKITGMVLEFGQSTIRAGLGVESLKNRLSALSGSAEAGAESFQWIDEFAKRTPYGLEAVSSSFEALVEVGINPMGGALEKLTEVSSRFGGGQQRLAEITKIVADSFKSGTLSIDALNQMSGSGVDAAYALSLALGKSVEEVKRLAEAGQLGREDVLLLVGAMGELTKGSNDLLSESPGAKIEALQEQIESLKITIANSGLLDLVGDLAGGLTKLIDSLDPEAVGLFTEVVIDFAAEAGPAFETVGDAIKNMTVGLASMAEMYSALRLGTLSEVDYSGSIEVLEDQIEGLKRLRNETKLGSEAYDKYTSGITDLNTLIRSFSNETSKLTKIHRDATAVIDRLARGFKSESAALRELSGSLSEEEKKRIEAAKAAEAHRKEVERIKDAYKKGATQAVDEHQKALVKIDKQYKEALIRMREYEEQLRDQAEAEELASEALDNFGTRLGDIDILPEIVFDPSEWPIPQGPIEDYADRVGEVFGPALSMSFGSSFATLFDDMREGRIVDFEGFFDSYFGELGEVAGQSFSMMMSNAIMEELTGTGEGFKGLETGVEEMTGGQRAAMGLSGAYGVYQATQQADRSQAAMSGAIAGAQIGMQTPLGVWGAAIGAVVGAAVGYFGSSGEKPPRTSIDTRGSASGAFSFIDTRHQGVSEEEIMMAQADIAELFRDSFGQWRELVQQFGDPSLWESFEFPTIQLDGVKMTLDQALRYLAEEEIPDVMMEAFSDMIKTGFHDIGVSTEWMHDVFGEIENMSGDERVKTLSEIIEALQIVSEINTASFESIKENLNSDTMEQFSDLTADMVDKIAILGMGFEDLSLADQADEIITLGDAFSSFGDVVGQVLQAIQDGRDAMNATFDTLGEDMLIESFGDDTGAAGRYYMGQLDELQRELEGADSPEEISRIVSDMNRYLRALQSLGRDGETDIGTIIGLGATSVNDWVREYFENARETASGRYDFLEDEVRDDYELIRQQAADLGLGFVDLGTAADDVTGAFERLYDVTTDGGGYEDTGGSGGGHGETGTAGEGTTENRKLGEDFDYATATLNEAARQTGYLAEHSALLREISDSVEFLPGFVAAATAKPTGPPRRLSVNGVY